LLKVAYHLVHNPGNHTSIAPQDRNSCIFFDTNKDEELNPKVGVGKVVVGEWLKIGTRLGACDLDYTTRELSVSLTNLEVRLTAPHLLGGLGCCAITLVFVFLKRHVGSKLAFNVQLSGDGVLEAQEKLV
jgi:hypothetical protein